MNLHLLTFVFALIVGCLMCVFVSWVVIGYGYVDVRRSSVRFIGFCVYS